MSERVCHHSCPRCHRVFAHPIRGRRATACHMRERGRQRCERCAPPSEAAAAIVDVYRTVIAREAALSQGMAS
jgi:hypothetical protein